MLKGTKQARSMNKSLPIIGFFEFSQKLLTYRDNQITGIMPIRQKLATISRKLNIGTT